MRRQILEGEDVAGGHGDDGLGVSGGGEFAEALQNRDKIFNGAVVIDYEDEWAVSGAAEEHEQQGFGGRGESGDTNSPRALPEVGGYTRDGGKHFYVREEFADEGKQHAS
jgi:hypothetical protein